jgi:hypothetical protein
MAKDIHKITDEVSLVMRELIETTENNVVYEIGLALNKGADKNDVTTYKKTQVIEKPKLTKKILSVVKESQSQLANVVENIGTYTGTDTTQLQKKVTSGMVKLVNSAIGFHNQSVKRVVRLNNSKPLLDSILSQTQLGIDKGLPVTYANGRTVGYREYMEMAVRTSTQNEIGNMQLDTGARANIVFYVANEFNDCADDHVNYQGKVYYDERYLDFNLTDGIKQNIGSYIKQKNLLAIQFVRDKSPYFTTRPNCRHTLTPLSIDQVLGEQVEQVKKDMFLKSDTYKPENYDALQEQRKNERHIRNYKARIEMNQKLYAETKNELYIKQSQKDNVMMRKWQLKQRQLLKSNPKLERDYRKETKKILVNDLGVRYNLKVTSQTPAKNIIQNPPSTPATPQEIQEHYQMPDEKPTYYTVNNIERIKNATHYEVFNDFNESYTSITSKAWNKLNKFEKESLRDYTGKSYRQINAGLRNSTLQELENSGILENIKHIEKAINLSSIPQDVILHRYIQRESIKKMMGLSDDELKSMLKGDLDAIVGKEYVEKGFSSTSVTELDNGVFSFRGVHLEIFAPKGTKGIYTEPFHTTQPSWDGKTIPQQISNENELVLQRNTKFRVREVIEEGIDVFEQDKKTYRVKVEIINEDENNES